MRRAGSWRIGGPLLCSLGFAPALGSGGEAGFSFFGKRGMSEDLYLPAGFGDDTGSFGISRPARGFGLKKLQY